MSCIYAMSDIHGELEAFKQSLQNVDLSNSNNHLILLGDYIDRGTMSCETLYFIKDLYTRYPEQVIVLRGNHEEMFLEKFDSKSYLFTGSDFNEIQDYLSENELSSIIRKFDNSPSLNVRIFNMYKEMISSIESKHKDLINWLKVLPYYYETETQIYVHAGIDEESEEYWKIACENDYFVWKYPHVIGDFYKDIIAGHISTANIIGDRNYHNVFWDKKSHFYIDGEVPISKFIPVLKYDTVTGKYTSFEKVKLDDKSIIWQEYVITK